MKKLLKLSMIEFKNNIINKNIIFILLLFFLIIMLPPHGDILQKAELSFLSCTLYMMIIYFSGALGFEFEYKTYKIIFTSGVTRFKILLWKVFYIIIVSIFFCIIYNFITILIVIFSHDYIKLTEMFQKELPISFLHFLSLGICVGTFCIMISCITRSSLFSFIISFIFFGGIIADLIGLAGDRFEIDLIRNIIQNTPFYFAAYGFQNQAYTLNEIIVIIFSAVIFYTASCIVIMKRDLK